jgi:hypothetical protein
MERWWYAALAMDCGGMSRDYDRSTVLVSPTQRADARFVVSKWSNARAAATHGLGGLAMVDRSPRRHGERHAAVTLNRQLT